MTESNPSAVKKTLRITPAIGLAIDQQFDKAESLRAEADHIESLAKGMIKEFGQVSGFITEDEPFHYHREHRLIERQPETEIAE